MAFFLKTSSSSLEKVTTEVFLCIFCIIRYFFLNSIFCICSVYVSYALWVLCIFYVLCHLNQLEPKKNVVHEFQFLQWYFMLTKYLLDLDAVFCLKFKLDCNLLFLFMSKSSSFVFVMYSLFPVTLKSFSLVVKF